MDDESLTQAELSRIQKLKTAIHYTVGKICEEISAEYDNVQFSREFIATFAELTFRQIGSFAEDLELFARHAKRTVVAPDDVKLLVRRSKSLAGHIEERAEQLVADGEAQREKRRKAKTKVPLGSSSVDN